MTEPSHDRPGSGSRESVIVDVKIPFMSLVTLLVKAALAAIPAAMILAVLALVFAMLMRGTSFVPPG